MTVPTIRSERPEDIPFIRSVNEKAFGRLAEAGLVDKLRLACADNLSLVADDDGYIDDKAMQSVSGVATFRDEFSEAL